MKKNILLFELIIGAILSYVIIIKYFSGGRNFENLALGTETVKYQAVDKEGNLIHIIHIDSIELPLFLKASKNFPKKDILLFFGNSQTHSINQKKPGEVNYISLLADKQVNANLNVLCHSLPNANLQEFLLSYEYFKNKFPIKMLIIPVFMDDMREDGIRGDIYYPNLVYQKYLLEDSDHYVIKHIDENLRSFWSVSDISNSKNEGINALKETFQEKTELSLNHFLEKKSLTWNNRPNVRGDFFTWLYMARNSILGINASTHRKMIPQRYATNLHALELILQDCIQSKTKLLLYIPPIRSDVKIPYDSSEYQRFKDTIMSFSKKNQGLVFFRNFESIVPGKYWGYKTSTKLSEKSEIDFMHFQFIGHKILADSIQSFINATNR